MGVTAKSFRCPLIPKSATDVVCKMSRKGTSGLKVLMFSTVAFLFLIRVKSEKGKYYVALKQEEIPNECMQHFDKEERPTMELTRVKRQQPCGGSPSCMPCPSCPACPPCQSCPTCRDCPTTSCNNNCPLCPGPSGGGSETYKPDKPQPPTDDDYSPDPSHGEYPDTDPTNPDHQHKIWANALKNAPQAASLTRRVN